jgi:hypothetical protein
VQENHWIVHVAINSFAVLGRVLYPKDDLQFEYGYLTYNPMVEVNEFDNKGIIKNKKGPSCQLVFILNLMSFYQDLANHDLLTNKHPFQNCHQLWAFGGKGPFGCYLHPGMGTGFQNFDKLQQTDWLSGKFMVVSKNLFLLQTDCWNCGLFCSLFDMDFMMTQWRNSYAVFKVVQHQTDIDAEKIVWIPETYGLGTTFALFEQERGDGIEVCFLVPMEMKCLMERLHALYFTAYSKEDKYVPSELANLDADSHTYIKDSNYLQKYADMCVFPSVPKSVKILESIAIGKERRECLRNSKLRNYSKASIENQKAYKWRGNLVLDWRSDI